MSRTPTDRRPRSPSPARRLLPLGAALALVLAIAPPASAATASERYVGFDSGFLLTSVQMATVGCESDENVGTACFPLSVGGGRTATVTLEVVDDLGTHVPFGVVWWHGDGYGLSNLVLYCGKATVSHKAPAAGIVGVSVVIWGGHAGGLICPVILEGKPYVPGLPGTATITY